jgi:hypothetical protein
MGLGAQVKVRNGHAAYHTSLSCDVYRRKSVNVETMADPNRGLVHGEQRAWSQWARALRNARQ